MVAVALLATYVGTLAPGITLWDSAEFNAAVGSLGIPHPPGTPLYILLGRAWSLALGALPQALAMNLLSAVATALACGLLAGLVARWTGSRLTSVAAGLSSGTVLAVWQNATETEVYALSLLLAVVMVVVGERAGRDDSRRHRVLLGFLMALAVPLQISALVAAPAAIWLASRANGGPGLEAPRVGTLGGAFLVATGAGLVSPTVTGAGVIVLVVSAICWPRARPEALALAFVTALGLSATLYLFVRAAHDPLVNQGNPGTLQGLLDVLGRRQYDVPGLWPRRAPVWVQLLNLVQYADWQVASGLDDGVAASWWRTPWSVFAFLVAVAGAWLHRAVSRSTFHVTAFLLTCASLGIVAVLNLRAGPSILDTILPAGTTHEPRERDYFFALAFAVAGAWYGVGAVALARRWLAPASRVTSTMALTAAAMPLVLNWGAADRSRQPMASLATAYAEVLLASAPPRTVLLMAGDNDSYPAWHRQAVLGDRADVIPVTVPLLGAEWYRDELRRRHGLLDSTAVAVWTGEDATLRQVVEGALRDGRPVGASLAVPAQARARLAPGWTLRGLVFLAGSTGVTDGIDVAGTREVADLVVRRVPAGEVRARDPAPAWVERQLRCPGIVLAQVADGSSGPVSGLLASHCNLR